MKLVKRILIAMLSIVMLCTVTSYGATLTASTNKSTLEIGQTATITVTGTGVTGKVSISSSNSGAVSIDKSSAWVENGSVTVVATAKSVGSATITVTPVDVADSATGDTLSLGSKSVSITVNAPVKPEPEPEPEKDPEPEQKPDTNTTTTPDNPTTSTKPEEPTKPATPAEPTKSSNANLSNLGIKPNDFTGFRAANTSYTVNVPNEVNTIEVYANKGHDKQTITGTGKKSLDEGSNRFSVNVTAEDGTQKTYTITVVRLAKEETNNPDIEQAPEVKVALTSLSITGVTINEAFSPEKTEYTATAGTDVEKLKVKAVANVSDAKINIAGAEELTDGENIVTIRVKSQDGKDEKVYTIKVTKETDEEPVQEENNEVTTVVGSVENNNTTGGSGISMEKLLFCIGIGVTALLGVIFAFIIYKKDHEDSEDFGAIDFVGDISAKETIKDAAVATSKLAGVNMETAEENVAPVKRRGRHF